MNKLMNKQKKQIFIIKHIRIPINIIDRIHNITILIIILFHPLIPILVITNRIITYNQTSIYQIHHQFLNMVNNSKFKLVVIHDNTPILALIILHIKHLDNQVHIDLIVRSQTEDNNTIITILDMILKVQENNQWLKVQKELGRVQIRVEIVFQRR